MTDLDLAAIKERLGWFRDSQEQCRRSPGQVSLAGYAAAAIECGRDAPALVSEIERLDAENERLKRLLGPPEMPTVDSYENLVQALADERAAVVEHCDRNVLLTALLAEILGYFAGPYRDTMARSKFVPVETLDRWRSYLERAT